MIVGEPRSLSSGGLRLHPESWLPLSPAPGSSRGQEGRHQAQSGAPQNAVPGAEKVRLIPHLQAHCSEGAPCPGAPFGPTVCGVPQVLGSLEWNRLVCQPP